MARKSVVQAGRCLIKVELEGQGSLVELLGWWYLVEPREKPRQS